jgi:hypothetical protein
MTSIAAHQGVGDRRLWIRRVLIAIGLIAVAGALVWGGMSLIHAPSAPRRQVAKIMLLPDTPPPPPPTPDKPPPKEQPTHQDVNVPKPLAPPEAAQLKMEGAAGEGPSPFAAGEVKQDYIGGDIGNGSRYSAYVARLEQRIQSHLSRHKLKVANIKLYIWLSPSGAIQRITVQGGDGRSETQVREALGDMDQQDEAPLPDMPMPVGLTIN